MAAKNQVGNIFVNISEKHKLGHNKDTVHALNNSRYSKQFKIYQDNSKTPDSVLQLALEGILTSEVVLLDAILDDEETYKDRLIQFGIAFALDKQRYFFYIKDNSARERKIYSEYVDQFAIETLGYYSFTELLNEKIETLLSHTQPKPQKPTNTAYEAFSVIGVNELTNPDLIRTIKDFATQKKWYAVVYKPLSGTNIHEEISRHVAIRTFSVFCINKLTDINTYIAIGLALGFGVPFLILIEEDVIIPKILNGYAGVISYKNNTDLKLDLEKYTDIFFSPEIFETWDGFTYFYLLSKTEKRLNSAAQKSEIDEIEKIALAITKAQRVPSVQGYTLLGDTYRRKNQLFDPLNTDYLKQAIYFYKKALSMQSDNKRCIDGIDSTEKLIQLIDLIKDKNFSSMTELIYLIGNSINSDQYQYLRSFLVGEVKKLLNNKDYLPAIALLAAMQKHDKSDDLSKLWGEVDPRNFTELIQIHQENEIKLKAELKATSEKNTEIFNQLSNAYEEVEQANKIKTKLDTTIEYYGKTIFVNFGIGWATYMPIKGSPYIIRDNEKIVVKEGMPMEGGDTVFDADGKEQTHWLSAYENSILEYVRNQQLNSST